MNQSVTVVGITKDMLSVGVPLLLIGSSHCCSNQSISQSINQSFNHCVVGITKDMLSVGVSLPLQEAISHCRSNPPGDWPRAAYHLIGKISHRALLLVTLYHHIPLSLEVPGTELVTYGDRTFRVVAAKAWNQLPKNIRTAKTVDRFKADLKTHLFVL